MMKREKPDLIVRGTETSLAVLLQFARFRSSTKLTRYLIGKRPIRWWSELLLFLLISRDLVC